jgi:outer membrane protein OmpA-like peptidoglycan-associated protein
LLRAAVILAAILLFAGGIRFIIFKEQPEIVVKSVFQAPVSLYFDAGSTKLSTKDFPILDSIAEFLTENSQDRAVIRGYTDSKGSASQNLRIAAARAEAAKGYLVRKGVHSARIQAIAMGSQEPAAGSEPSAEQKLSRRVEIEIDTGKNKSQ